MVLERVRNMYLLVMHVVRALVIKMHRTTALHDRKHGGRVCSCSARIHMAEVWLSFCQVVLLGCG
jgi:hypothetical protein